MESRPDLLRHIKDVYGDDLQALEDAARAVERLKGDTGWAILSALVSREAAAVAGEVNRDDLLRDHPTLSNRLGKLSGIRTFEDFADAVLHRHSVVLAEQQAKHEGAAASGDAG